MNAIELLEHLKAGATLKTGYRRRTMNAKARRQYILTLSDGTEIKIQASAINALLSHKQIHIIDFGRSTVEFGLGEYREFPYLGVKSV